MIRKGLLAGIVLCFLWPPLAIAEDVWLLIDTKKLQLQVRRGEKTVMVFDNIAIGRNGAGFKTHRGDDVTPRGQYRIAWINNNSAYYRFFGFDYPTQFNAVEGLNWGLINRETYRRIIAAHEAGEVPPQNTVLGGQIGIHGLGKADKAIHKLMNWTHGCIALTNEQIDRLTPWVKKGIPVKVK
ncbi:L,D-transpeptidase [Methylomarinum sp. Ch1-1]|uniref:L,D-transpeptidase n=1 Tax=Methylomarinum roseum TaxID=3067653 RepID=A0AAU7NVG6_9GAMM|nr:L,D-transpeptidase [Methylomarinum sp. Ch1-1]MDP4523031.1 L,D-transpeptidase [Methylomarinum sp. Ch1-1]